MDLLIAEAFPSLGIEQIESLEMGEWLQRAVQAEYVLGQIRKLPGIPTYYVDALLGVPLELLEEKRQRDAEALKAMQAELIKSKQHRKIGEKGPVDPQQMAEFMEAHEQTKVETAFGGGLGIPKDMMEEVDFELPDTFLKAAGIKPQKGK